MTDMHYELVACGGGVRIGSVEKRTQHSLELRDWHLADEQLLAKHQPFVVRGGTHQTGPWRVVSSVTPCFTFHVPGGWPEAQEAYAIRLAEILNALPSGEKKPQ